MRRSKRNIGSVYGSPVDRFEHSKVRLPSQPISKSIHWRSKSGLDKDSLLGAIFGQMVPHVWFRLLPSDGDICGTVAFSVGQEWDLLSPFLYDVKMLRKKGDKTIVNIEMLSSLQHTLNLPDPIHYGYSRGIGKVRTHYLCSGTPLHKSPNKQESTGYTHVNLRFFLELTEK